MLLLCPVCGSPLDNCQSCDHQHDCDGQADPCIANEAGNDVGYEGYRCGGQGVGQLSGYVYNVVALAAGRCHDGGVGDGGAVVTAYSTGHAGGYADDTEGIGEGEYCQSDGDQYAEGTPAGAGGESQEAADKEYDGGQEGLEAGSGTLYQSGNIFAGAQRIGHGLKGPCEGEDQDGGNHGLEAFGYAAHQFIKAHQLAAEVVDEGEYQSKGGTQHQAYGSIAPGEGGYEVHVAAAVNGEEAAGVQHADYAADDEEYNGKYQVDNAALGVELFVRSVGVGIAAGEQVAVVDGVALIPAHGAKVGLHDNQTNHHNDGEDGVEVIRNGVDEEGEAGTFLNIGRNCCCPGRDGSYDADGSRGSVDEVGQLCAGYVMLVSEGTHNGTYGKAVKVVIDEDEYAEGDGGQLCAYTGLDVSLCPAAESGAAACAVHQGYHYAQDDQEYQYANIVAVGQYGYYAVIESVGQGAFKGEVRVEQSAGHDADKQGGINLLGHQSEGDGDNGGKQRPDGVVEARGLGVRTGCGGEGCDYEEYYSQNRHYKDDSRVAPGGGFHEIFLLKNYKKLSHECGFAIMTLHTYPYSGHIKNCS